MPQDHGFREPPRFDVHGYDSDYEPRFDKANEKTGKYKGDKQSGRVETSYEGCILEKVTARPGERESWSRVGKRQLPGNDVQLAELSSKYRKIVGNPIEAFSRLDSDQKGVVLRYVEMRQRQETDKNAIWSLDCVVRHVKPVKVKNAWTAQSETKHIKVIIRREDSSRVQGGIRSSGHPGHFAAGEIIDLAEPFPKSKDEKKSNKKKKSSHETFDDYEPPYVRVPTGGVHDPLGGHGRDPNSMHAPPPPPPPPPPMVQEFPPQHMLPPGAIPVHQFHPVQHHGPANPFQPHDEFNTPDLYSNDHQFPLPMHHDSTYQTRQQTPIEAQLRSRSHSRERRRQESRERRSIEEQRRNHEALRLQQEERLEADRRQQRIENQRTQRKLDELTGNFQDQMQELTATFADLGHRHRRSRYTSTCSSNDSLYRDNLKKVDMWSLPSGGSFTPPSTPGRESPVVPNGTLGRAQSKHYRDGGRPRRSGRNNYHHNGQVIMEPYINTPPPRERGRLKYRHVHRRNNSFDGVGNPFDAAPDDYPYPPTAPMPPPSDPARRFRAPQVHQQHQRAATSGGNDTSHPVMRALPEFPEQHDDLADFGHRRKRRDQSRRGTARGERYAYANADDAMRSGVGRRMADRVQVYW